MHHLHQLVLEATGIFSLGIPIAHSQSTSEGLRDGKYLEGYLVPEEQE